MGADISRETYDAAQYYRRVVVQQGRVTVDPDLNEAQEILSEETRKDALDMVGPAGTPDDGYRVGVPATLPAGWKPFDFTVQKGTMYLAGLRVRLPETITYSAQTDWLHVPALPTKAPANELIVQRVREHEVGAVEDHALREVALGGPDTAQRVRLIQHIERYATTSADCAGALAEVAKDHWPGLQVVGPTGRLEPTARLLVTLKNVNKQPDPCEPASQGGYLGADNQLIRVQVSKKGLLWGFDNASFLYRVDVATTAAGTTVVLKARPVDAFHQPRANQAVELLRSTAQLHNGAYVAASTGEVRTPSTPYDPDKQSLTLTPALPAEYQTGDKLPPVFLRVWEQELPLTSGTPIDLGTTGVQVTLTGGPFAVGSFWLIAVRPSTPVAVYPGRYLDGPQPPDGPRQWVCPLALLGWNAQGGITSFHDCRNPFGNLVTLTKHRFGGCCTVTVLPADLQTKSLQEILNQYQNQDQVTVCLMPGTYTLPGPLRLGPGHSNLTLEGCHDGAVVQAAANAEAQFVDGLIVLTDANNVTLRRLRFELPQVPFNRGGGKLANMDSPTVATLGLARVQQLMTSVGVRALHCANLAVKDCLFRYSLTPDLPVFGAGVFLGSECWGLTLHGNRFVYEEDFLRATEGPLRVLYGLLLAPALRYKLDGKANLARSTSATLVVSLLEDASLENNLFSGISAAALVYADVGVVQLAGNVVRNNYAGFAVFSLGAFNLGGVLATLQVDRAALDLARQLAGSLTLGAVDPLLLGLVLALAYPLPAEFDLRHAMQVDRQQAADTKAELALAQQYFDALLSLYLPPVQEPAPVTVPPPPGTTTTPTAGTTTSTPPAKTKVPIGQVTPAAGRPPTPQDGERLAVLKQHVALLGSSALAVVVNLHRRQLSLHCENNDLETLAQPGAGYGLLIREDERGTGTTALLHANKVRSQSADYAVSISLVERCTVTGNIVANEATDERGRSLQLVPGPSRGKTPLVAVTGNVLLGSSSLPPRNKYSDPLNRWDVFNTETS
jgi:hypothetical protein